MKQIIALLQAIQFYTIIPVPLKLPWKRDSLDSASKFLPLIGALQGFLTYLVFLALHKVFPIELSLLLSLALAILFSGGIHEEGTLRYFSQINLSYRRPHRSSEIHFSALGFLVLLFLTLVKWQALLLIPKEYLMWSFICSYSLSHWNVILVLTTLPHIITEGVSKPIPRKISARGFTFAFLTGMSPFIALYFYVEPYHAFALVLPMIAVLLLRFHTHWKLKGYTLDSLGAVQQFSEVSFFLSVAALLHFYPI